ncbi:hypothetical protein C8R45DRAFT_1171267 [Mycena sanguinolenta]|nr:hypothetical protein C8R45DRAFT_1171267 [Mycena sanguinolenta]
MSEGAKMRNEKQNYVEDERSMTKPEIKMKRKQNKRARIRRKRKKDGGSGNAPPSAPPPSRSTAIQSFVAPVRALTRGANRIWRLDADEGRRDEREAGKATGRQDMGTGRDMTAGRDKREQKEGCNAPYESYRSSRSHPALHLSLVIIAQPEKDRLRAAFAVSRLR